MAASACLCQLNSHAASRLDFYCTNRVVSAHNAIAVLLVSSDLSINLIEDFGSLFIYDCFIELYFDFCFQKYIFSHGRLSLIL